jgi:hypothetical protein
VYRQIDDREFEGIKVLDIRKDETLNPERHKAVVL